MGIPAVLFLLFVTGLGYVKLMLDASRREDQRLFVEQYLSRFQKVSETPRDEIDQEMYFWLTHRVLKMQRLLIDPQIWRHYEKTADRGDAARQAQLLLELLEDLDQRLVPVERIKATRAFLVRFLGALDDDIERLGKRRFNPFTLFREGIQLVLLAPVLFFVWATRSDNETLVNEISENPVFARWAAGLSAFCLILPVLILIFGWPALVAAGRGLVFACYDAFFAVVDLLQEFIDSALGRVPAPPTTTSGPAGPGG